MSYLCVEQANTQTAQKPFDGRRQRQHDTHTHKYSIDLKKSLIKQGDHVIKDYDVQSIHFSIYFPPLFAYNTNLPQKKLVGLVRCLVDLPF